MKKYAPAIICLALISCASSNFHGLRSGAEIDVQEAVFRYQFIHNYSGKKADWPVYFLSLADRMDPSNGLLARFSNNSPPVKVVSKSIISQKPEDKAAVVDVETGKHGIVFTIRSMKWQNNNTATVQVDYYVGNLNGAVNRYLVSYKKGKWVVIYDRLIVIS